MTTGSPPHARGRQVDPAARGPAFRFTPARAGKTSTRSPAPGTTGATTVHPRTRGEDSQTNRADSRTDGSPPHARGRRRRPCGRRYGQRFTPARAGKTWSQGQQRLRPAVHPRTRGEDSGLMPYSGNPAGSPPHARGRPGLEKRVAPHARFTPARAGKTQPRVSAQLVGSVHPRTRGEDPLETVVRMRSYGSPPHARGRRWS